MNINELTEMWEEYDTDSIYKPVQPNQFPIGWFFKSKFKSIPAFTLKSRVNSVNDCNKFITDLLSKIGKHTLISKSYYDSMTGHQIYHIPYTNTLMEVLISKNQYDTLSSSPEILNDDGISFVYISVFSDDVEHFDKIKKIVDEVYSEPPSQGYMYVLIKSNGYYDIKPFTLSNSIDIDILKNYNDDFYNVHTEIVKSLSEKNKSGLVLLHGLPGTGKSYYIRHLARILNKKVIFIPPYMTEFLTSPEMLPFLIDHPDTILIIEDAEKVITDREHSISSGVSNILNITDGILSDILKMQIIATFNMDKTNIDKALLRKGRLIAEYEFGKLSVEKSNEKLKEMGKGYTTDVPMTLTDIYNIDDTDYGSNIGSINKTIGFN